ncbi:MAG TPA: TonB-dependent receptor [Thermoanaerobaculia bacterium]|nr:TonB-dependent receptor [Thermoanaerobaculia bacterium]
MLKRFLLAMAVIAAFALPAGAQTTTGTIRGNVTDSEGAALPGVTIIVTGEQGVARTVVSGANGSYLIAAMPPGVYSVEATLEGMLSQKSEDIRVTIGGMTTVSFALRAGLSEEMTVTAAPPLLDLTSNQVSTNYSAELIEDLPTRRQFWDVVAMSPGISATTEWTASQSAYGSSITSNSWNVDGLNVTAPETGGAWWYINPETVEEIQVLGIGASAEFGNMTGAAINVVTKSGTNKFTGSLDGYFQFDDLTGTNVELADEEHPTYVRDHYHNVTGTLGGPLLRDRLWFFLAGETNRDREAEPGVDPDFPARYDWDRYDIKLDATFGAGTKLDAKGHWEDYEIGESGSAFISPSARGVRDYSNPAWGAGLSHVISDRSLLEVRYAGWWGDESYESLTGSTDPAFADYSPPGGGPTVYSGGLLFPFEYETYVHQGDVKLSHYASDFLHGDHDFRFGVGYNYGAAETLTKPGSGGGFYYHYTYEYEGTPYEYYYLYTFTPFLYGAKQESMSAFVNDSWRITDRLTLNLGVRYDRHNGRIPSYERLDENANGTGEMLPGVDDVIDWSLISPRLGFAWVATGDQKTVVRGSFGIYHDGSVSGNWSYPPPGIPPIQTFLCDGPATSCDDLYTETVFPTALNVDPGLDPPRSEQYSLGVERQIGSTMAVGATVLYKETKDLIGWEILDDGVYQEVPYTDPFTGRVYTLLDLCPAEEGCRPATIRKGNRPGAGSLAPDEDYHQKYSAFMLTFNRRHSDGWSLQGSYTWSRSEGLLPRPLSQSQGSVLYGSLDGSDPNEWLNADQLLQADRKHMFRVQGEVDLPWDFEGSMALNWQSGRPYARIDRARLGQGSTFFIIDPASDDRRLPSTTLLDLGLRKRFTFKNDLELELGVDVFNVLNEDSNTFWESLWVGPDESYVESDWVWPRRAMIRVGMEF